MLFRKTGLDGSYLVDLQGHEDHRGFFARMFCEKQFEQQGLNTHWVQINNSVCKQTATLRGLHYQRPPHSEVKLFRCTSGSIWDVVVDLRAESKTFGKWFGAVLSSVNRTMMYVPKGFAHGFVSLQPETEIIYLTSAPYFPEAEGVLAWDDIDVGIEWPVVPTVVSEKDARGLSLEHTQPISSDDFERQWVSDG